MKPSSGSISIAASAQKLDVDQRISLRYYYRIANNLLKQADIYRMEKNIIDLYVMLLRFSSLITETIPQHRDYHISLQRERIAYRKKLSSVLGELEVLKPDVQHRLQELNKKARNQLNRFDQAYQRVPGDNSLEWPAVNKQTLQNNAFSQARGMVAQNRFSPAPLVQRDKISQSRTSERKFSLSIPRPKEETLSRHSILGPNGLHGQWQPPVVSRGIQYPSSLDLTPVEIPSLEAQDQPRHDVSVPSKDNAASEHEKSTLEAVLSLHDNGSFPCVEETCSVIAPDVASAPTTVDIVREPSPPPVLAEVQDLVPVTSQVPNMSLQDNLVQSESPLEVHISTTMMESFMKLAKSNTDRNLETCGVLAGLLKNRKFYITALIIPKQESTSDSCQTTNEEEIFDYQDKQSLFPLGWIHTHPTQSCFMSSIDVHTHYSYQIMLPESIAIVMAPKDVSRKHGIFRLTAPGGMSVIRQCQQRGFHPHPEPADGGPIYDHCTDVYMNPNLKFDVADLR